MSVRARGSKRLDAHKAAWLLALAACSGGGTTGPNPPQSNVAGVVIDPNGMTLPVGGRGQLNAVVRDAAGNTLSGVAVNWSSRNPLIASVSGGTVDGNAAGLVEVIAATGSRADTVNVLVIDNFTLEVTPPLASVRIGQSAQFTAIARDATGNVIPLPPVSWASSSPPTATISNTGLALGQAGGVSSITAAALRVTSPPASLQVVDPNAPCGGITNVASWEGQVDYGFKAVRLPSRGGGFSISADDVGSLKATMTLRSTGPFIALWHGDITGSASVTQKKENDTLASDVVTLSGGGAIVPEPVLGQPQMSLLVDLQACSFRLIAAAVIETVLTERGSQRRSAETVATLQFAGGLGAWRSLNLSELNDAQPAHSLIWQISHLNLNSIAPLGLAVQLFDGTDTEPPVGLGSGGFIALAK